MKNTKKIMLFCLLGLGIATTNTGCKTGEGCENTLKYAAETDGEKGLSMKRGKSNLYSKKQRKKMKRP